MAGSAGDWQRASRRVTSSSFREVEWRPTLAQSGHAPSAEDVLAASGGMQWLRDVLPSVVQDALRIDLGGGHGPAGCGPLGTLGGWERDARRVAPEDGVDPGW